MKKYLKFYLKRLLLIIPTLFGIMLVNFIIIQAAPGGPVQQILAKIRGESSDIENRFGGGQPTSGWSATLGGTQA